MVINLYASIWACHPPPPPHLNFKQTMRPENGLIPSILASCTTTERGSSNWQMVAEAGELLSVPDELNRLLKSRVIEDCVIMSNQPSA